MASLKRNEGEYFPDYKNRRKKNALDTFRALRARPLEEGMYDGKPPTYIRDFDPETMKIIVPVIFRKLKDSAIPFTRGESHPKTISAALETC